MTHPVRLTVQFLLIAAAGVLFGSCQRIYPVRTLPNWVRGIYVPMVQNKSTEPGLEELVTQLMQQEFLADGRLRIVPKESADLQIAATIQSYRVTTDRKSNDQIVSSQEIEMVTNVALLDPTDDPFEPDQAIATLLPIRTRYTWNSDPRSVSFSSEPEYKREAMDQLARQIVDMTINGFPIELKDVPVGTDLPATRAPGLGQRGNIFRNRRFD